MLFYVGAAEFALEAQLQEMLLSTRLGLYLSDDQILSTNIDLLYLQNLVTCQNLGNVEGKIYFHWARNEKKRKEKGSNFSEAALNIIILDFHAYNACIPAYKWFKRKNIKSDLAVEGVSN